jgi:CcmD family protein
MGNIPVEETISVAKSMSFLFAAYSVVWLVFFIYLFSLHKKQKAISEEMALLGNKISRPGR